MANKSKLEMLREQRKQSMAVLLSSDEYKKANLQDKLKLRLLSLAEIENSKSHIKLTDEMIQYYASIRSEKVNIAAVRMLNDDDLSGVKITQIINAWNIKTAKEQKKQ